MQNGAILLDFPPLFLFIFPCHFAYFMYQKIPLKRTAVRWKGFFVIQFPLLSGFCQLSIYAKIPRRASSAPLRYFFAQNPRFQPFDFSHKKNKKKQEDGQNRPPCVVLTVICLFRCPFRCPFCLFFCLFFCFPFFTLNGL